MNIEGKKVVVFGATGRLGRSIVNEISSRGYNVRAVVRDKGRAEKSLPPSVECRLVNGFTLLELEGVLQDADIVISALGKSVSPNDKSSSTFEDVDLGINRKILEASLQVGIKKFAYVSAFHAEKYPNLNYFRVHQQFSDELMRSGIDYLIVQPPALFSAFIDVMELASKGRNLTLGDGSSLTNPVHENDVAIEIGNRLEEESVVISVGGPEILSRKQLAQIIQTEVNPKYRVKSVPAGFIRTVLPVLKWFDKNQYDKFAFFLEVSTTDTIAPQLGKQIFREYIRAEIERAQR